VESSPKGIGIEGAGTVHLPKLNPGDGPGGPAFVEANVGVPATEDLVAALAMKSQGELVGHRSRRHVEGGLFAEFGGHRFFEGSDARVFSVDVVAHRRIGHRSAHRRGWKGHRIGAQIDLEHGLR